MEPVPSVLALLTGGNKLISYPQQRNYTGQSSHQWNDSYSHHLATSFQVLTTFAEMFRFLCVPTILIFVVARFHKWKQPMGSVTAARLRLPSFTAVSPRR